MSLYVEYVCRGKGRGGGGGMGQVSQRKKKAVSQFTLRVLKNNFRFHQKLDSNKNNIRVWSLMHDTVSTF